MMHGHEKSDSVIVAVKPANKAVPPAAEQSAAEPVAAEPAEPRAETKGNADQQTMLWAQSQTSMPHALERIREVARERKKEKFISPSTTSSSISSRTRSTNSKWMRHREWTG
jgi:RNA-directed DNA polymerase